MISKNGLIPTSLQRSTRFKILNAALCLGLGFVLFGFVRSTLHFFPITIEAIIQLYLAERNRKRSKSRIRQVYEHINPSDPEKAWSPLSPTQSQAKYLASVVGYREDLSLFTKCLQSYGGCSGLETLLVGIDGNEPLDLEMANVAGKVFPGVTEYISLDEPLAHMATRLARAFVEKELQSLKQYDIPTNWNYDDLPVTLRNDATSFAMDQVYMKAAEILKKHDALYSDNNLFRVICIYQPHISKKGIMFTNLVLATVLGNVNHLEYLWTSDSDTWVTPTTLLETVGCMELDPLIGGTCSSLGIHNAKKNLITTLGSAIYWSELAITRGQTGAIDAVDCQPGPCAAFRLNALSPNLFDWYTQSSMGIKTVVNEDRHLTTRLLLDGWKVTFNTETIAYTDTPTTLVRWILQQIRWARANLIETFQYPDVYAIHNPILFLTAVHRFYGPLSAMFLVVRYAVFGATDRKYSPYDFLGRIILCSTYNYIRDRRHACNLLVLCLAQIFYQLPLPGIIVYASMTALEGGWGTSMRNTNEMQKARAPGRENLRSITAVTLWMGVVAAALARLIASSFCPAYTLHLMALFGASMMSSLFWFLLRDQRKV